MLLVAVFFAGYGWGYKSGEDARFEELLRLIERREAPEFWKEIGGTATIPIPSESEDPFAPAAGEDPFAGHPFR
ncbi:MAG: hypothetical protein KY475_07895 [Planctomycetes bacterium]|nr:hypothetical protein [Planctomycetota bacterium]